MVRLLPKVSLEKVYILLSPKRYISNQPDESGIVGRSSRIRRTIFLAGFFILNILLFLPTLQRQLSEVLILVPLTAGITYWLYTLGLRITGNPHDTIQTFRTVVYSTGIYLCLFVGALVTFGERNVAIHRTLRTLSGQGEAYMPMFLQPLGRLFFFVYVGQGDFDYFLDGPGSYGMQPQLMMQAQLILVVTLFLYYLYSLYISARIRHDASRTDAVTITLLSIFGFHLTYLHTPGFRFGAFAVGNDLPTPFIDAVYQLAPSRLPAELFVLWYSAISVLFLIFIVQVGVIRYE